GARQAGKTTFLKEQTKSLNSSYVSFDDPDVISLFEKDIKQFESQFIEGHDVTVLDEVQYCEDAGKKLKYLVDKGRKICLSSSSEILLGKETLSYLVGRVSVLKLYPFSLREFLISKGQKEWTKEILERHIWEHATYGGYPKVVTAEGPELKKTILGDLYETMILKDVARTFSIDDFRTLGELAKYLVLNSGSLLSFDGVSKDVGISFPTLKKYLDALEKSYFIARVPPFYTNKTKEITKQPKVYFVDTGLRNFVAKSFNPEIDGQVFENYVFSELLKLGFSPKYWRKKGKAEVDFVVEKGSEIIPIEIKLSARQNEIERSLRTFIEEYEPKKAMVVSYKASKNSVKLNGCEVFFTDVPGMAELLLHS
ncbi:MAG: ATP-binding protein, partial [Candidatus Micrarchaeota archaeon]